MPFNLLLFPLVGGYYILIRFRYLRYIQYRLESQRVLLNSAIAGIMLLAVCFLLRTLFIAIFPETVAYLSTLLPIRTPYFGTTSMSLFVAVGATEFANLFINRLDAIKKAIFTSGNEFELLLSSSFFDAHLLQFTMDSGKFYIGWVKELPKPFTTSYIRITPAFSGYRNNDKELVFTTQYLTVYASYIEDGSVANTNELKTDLVLKADKINSVSFFDMDMYNRFNPVQE
ncbi:MULTISPECIES: hypothetical protein [unclassified Pedobacter]|uniref:hypothetical protein n=1 Tax=unclassified Pedobacter TaxID=2628915 RepID=UPI000B4AA795|nr:MULTISPECIES: hypothetical protein [unclassified Pedobacter]MCX2429766.1 hypothetical protein [Pedobacter sp. GR22-10]OWK70763.1 hypothetical protein CBW18_06585 [Pedobacter sp. AJM]